MKRILFFMSFEELQLAPPILKALTQCGYSKPTPVQAAAIPMVLAGRDIIASAQTGTGKTAAFVLPALQRLSSDPKPGPRVLVLTPTRELAGQITQAIHTYGRYLRVTSVAIFGGMPFGEQLRALSQSPDMIIATPGRLLDLMGRRQVDLSRIEFFVLDEADRMLDMGFIDDVGRISESVPDNCQTLLFAATVGPEMIKLSKGLMKNPERIEVSPGKLTVDKIEQRLHIADSLEHKHRLLEHLCADSAVTKAIIFSATRRDADSLARDLNRLGHTAAPLHADMTQNARNRTMINMRRGKIRLLVATDVAARGIDVSGISHVINFDLPRFPEDYVHRIGRTGRAGDSGIAISFASRGDLLYLDRIERYIGQNLTMHVIPGLEPVHPMQKPPGRPTGAGRPYSSGNRSGGQRSRAETGHFSPRETGTKDWAGRGKGAPRRGREVTVEYRSGKPNGAGRTDRRKPGGKIFS
jgi:superfamily II DNA/RNA helicase